MTIKAIKARVFIMAPMHPASRQEKPLSRAASVQGWRQGTFRKRRDKTGME
jgi:hypothetical protein